MSSEKNINFTFNFHAPVGQNIAHVDKIEAHFDKDMGMQIIDTDKIIEAPTSEEKNKSLIECIETLMEEKDEDGNYLVSQGNHWIAIYRIVVDKKLGAASADYLGFCSMINKMQTTEFRIPLKQENLKTISKTKYTSHFDRWTYDPVYNTTRKPYDKMVAVAKRFKEILEENGL